MVTVGASVTPATQPDTTIGGGSSQARSVQLTDSGDLITAVGHGFAAGDIVTFSEIVSTTGLTPGVLYYVRTAGLTADAFTVSTTGAGGTIVTLTTDGRANVSRLVPYTAPSTHRTQDNATTTETSKTGDGSFSTEYGAAKAATLTIATDLVGVAAHGYVAGDAVVFSSIATTTGITAGTVYYVIASGLTPSAFKVSATAGGSTVDLATGDGTATVRKYNATPPTGVVSQSNIDTNTGGGTPTRSATLTDSGDLVRLPGHGYVAGTPVSFSEISGTTGLTAGATYYVIAANLTADAFQVATTAGGSAVALTTDGTANVRTNTVYAAPPSGQATVTPPETNLGGGGITALRSATLTDAGDLVRVPGHGYLAGTPVVFSSIVSTTGLTAGTRYYVIAAGLTADVFQVSATVGGAAVALTTDGTANVKADPVYRAPSADTAVTVVETAMPAGASYSGHPIKAATLTDTGDLVTVNAHGYANGDQVVFSTIVSTTGLTAGQRYYVISSTTNTFQVSTSAGGSAVALTTNGTANVQKTSISTDVAGNLEMSQVGALADASAPGYAVPAAPTGVSATPQSNGEVTIAWTAPAQVTGAPRIGYYIESSLGMSVYVAGNILATNIQAWRTEADNQQPQTFTVRAVNKNGSGPKSAAAGPVDIVLI